MIGYVLEGYISAIFSSLATSRSTYRFSFFSSPGRSLGRAIVLPPASALALASALTLVAALAKC